MSNFTSLLESPQMKQMRSYTEMIELSDRNAATKYECMIKCRNAKSPILLKEDFK